VADLEARIEEAERGLAECARQLQACGDNLDLRELNRLSQAYSAAQTELDALLEEWAGVATMVGGERSLP
jgi:ABC-type transporter Mla subunit MlaD